jgi:hypothetical protein
MMKIEESGSISQMHGSADPDPDPQQNVMDPQHWLVHHSRHLGTFWSAVPSASFTTVSTLSSDYDLLRKSYSSSGCNSPGL